MPQLFLLMPECFPESCVLQNNKPEGKEGKHNTFFSIFIKAITITPFCSIC